MSDTELLHIPDAAGNTLTVRKIKDHLWPDFDVDALKGVETMPLKEGDVFVMAYPKSGTHWVWEITRLLLAGTVDVPLIEKDVAMIEDVGHEKLETLPTPRTLNTHAHFDSIPKQIMKHHEKCKLIYVTRDPRDVAVSYFNHHKKLVQYYNYKGEWKDYFPLFLNGSVDYDSWFTYTRGWEQGIKDHPELNVHITSYEALHENTHDEIDRLAKFLSVKADDVFIRKIVHKASFDNMKVTKGKAEIFEGVEHYEEPVMYRKGKVGDWKNWFTVSQSEHFDDLFEREMLGTKAYGLYSHTSQRRCGPDNNMNDRP